VQVAQEITSIQPGGGLCMSLELAWGKVRRACLRLFRPHHVRRMLLLRQGICLNCSHDIIDSRDLKFYRNVCGYWFADEDDPFRWRNRLPLARVGLAEVVIFSLGLLSVATLFALAALAVHGLCWILSALAIVLWVFVLAFFRDPERIIPTDPQALVSPADGRVTDIEEVSDADFPGGRALRISIFLSIFNVHVNRAPRQARVLSVRYFPGRFLDARDGRCETQNEQLWLDLVEDAAPRLLRVKQIAGAVARRIVCWLKPGDRLEAGERFGMIKFGSRTEVLVPAVDVSGVPVKVGDVVHGGSSVLLHLKNSPAVPA
jgi:phosphatidylserine decarboxylase